MEFYISRIKPSDLLIALTKGLEPLTYALTVHCSNQLSYINIFGILEGFAPSPKTSTTPF